MPIILGICGGAPVLIGLTVVAIVLLTGRRSPIDLSPDGSAEGPTSSANGDGQQEPNGQSAPQQTPSAGPEPETRPAQDTRENAQIEQVITEVSQLAGSAEEARTSESYRALRLALFRLDQATAGKASTANEEAARVQARRALGSVPVREPRTKDLWSLYSVGFFSFGDRNLVAEGVPSSMGIFEDTPGRWRYCSEWQIVSGLYLYREDVEQILVRAEGVLRGGVGKGSRFHGEVKLSDKGEAAWVTAVLREAFLVSGGVGIQVYFQEGDKDMIVIVSIDVLNED